MLQTTAIPAGVGSLRHRLDFKSVGSTTDSFGVTINTTPTTIATLWGSIEPISGRELELINAVQAEVTHKVVIRYNSGIDASDQFTHDSRVFQIESVRDADERKAYMLILAKELKV
jgi:SPP1 family predicted phage head-tail adaptor